MERLGIPSTPLLLSSGRGLPTGITTGPRTRGGGAPPLRSTLEPPYRRELWREMARTIRAFAAEEHPTLPGAAWYVRDRGRHAGRRVEHRTVSRTLLVKGLEFDHAIVLSADAHDGPNLYVALTRGSRAAHRAVE